MAEGTESKSFFTASTDRLIKKAEDSLNESLEQERPDELGRKLKEQAGDTSEDLPEVDPKDGHNWKERYANLQRFVQKKQNDFKASQKALEDKIAELTTKIENFTTKAAPAALPESAEDVEELKKENPAAYNAIVRIAKTLAEEIVTDRMKALDSEVRVVRQAQKQVEEESAYIKLQKLHPDLDLDTLESTPEFVEWIENKSKRMQDALFNNKSDIEAASEVLTLFKLETGFGKKKSPKKDPKKFGAEDINTKAPVELPDGDRGFDFTESEIEAKSAKDHGWFEKNFEKIETAMRSGRVLRDISDPIGTAKKMAALGL